MLNKTHMTTINVDKDKPSVLSRYFFAILLFLLQCVFIVLFGVHAEYGLRKRNDQGEVELSDGFNEEPVEGDVEIYYSFFQDVHVMIFIGFGFLMTFLRRYSFSALCFNFLVSAFTIQWALLLRGYAFHWHSHTKSFPVDVSSLLHADFVCASILISFGALLGKVNPAQLIVLALIEVVIQVWNQYVGTVLFCTFDAGESIFVHVFGAYFGLAVSFVLHDRDVLKSTKQESSYSSNVFSMIGTLFLFCFWPSFNAGTAYGDGKLRAIVNTYVSISTSCVLTFVVSSVVGKGKKEIEHIQNATLAGGVAVGTFADKNIGLFGAMIVGSVAGIVSTLGFKFLSNLLKKIRLHDTCGVHNLHGLPGIISGLGGIVVASMSWRSLYHENLSDKCLSGGTNRSSAAQAGFQFAGLVLTLAMAIVGGLLTGLLLRLPIFSSPSLDTYFDDSLNWHVPDDFHENKIEQTKIIKRLFTRPLKSRRRTNQYQINPNTIEVIADIVSHKQHTEKRS